MSVHALLPSTDLVEQLNQAAPPARLAEASKAEASWHFNRTRPALPPPPGTVPMASWWSNREVEMAPGRWCREPPPYAFPKPALRGEHHMDGYVCAMYEVHIV